MTFSTSAKPLGYYVGGDQLFEQLQDRYGCYFESMERHWKLIFRASLCAYQVMRPIWDDEANSISCTDSCIAGGGGDDYNIWDENPELADFINQACDSLGKSDLEGLIEALTAQLKGGV